MARIAGRVSRAQVSTNAGSSYSYINGIVDATLNASVAALKTTAHDDGDYEVYMMGRKNLSLDLKMRWDEGDAGQVALLTSWTSTNTLYLYRFRLQEGTGFQQFTMSGLITKYNPTGPNDDVAGLDVTIQLSATLTNNTQ